MPAATSAHLRVWDMQYLPGDALVATYPFSPVPMFVCHGCLSLPGLSSFPAYFPLPVCPLCDGTRCPWCYYPRTLPGRARGRFPPIIVISNGQPGERGREWARGLERKGRLILTEPLSRSLSLSGSALDNQLLKSVGRIIWLIFLKC